MNTNFLKDALKSEELSISLDNISTDDGKEIEDYTPQEIIAEARYVLSCFYEGGHLNNEWLNSHIKEDRKEAQQEVKALKSFIKKHEATL
jgi:predicted nucleic acid-binding protein